MPVGVLQSFSIHLSRYTDLSLDGWRTTTTTITAGGRARAGGERHANGKHSAIAAWQRQSRTWAAGVGRISTRRQSVGRAAAQALREGGAAAATIALRRGRGQPRPPRLARPSRPVAHALIIIGVSALPSSLFSRLPPFCPPPPLSPEGPRHPPKNARAPFRTIDGARRAAAAGPAPRPRPPPHSRSRRVMPWGPGRRGPGPHLPLPHVRDVGATRRDTSRPVHASGPPHPRPPTPSVSPSSPIRRFVLH